MIQGDAYSIPITGTGFDISEVEKIEFVIGDIIKSYPTEVTYNSSTGKFLFPVTQAETFTLCGMQPAQARVKFTTSGDVIGASMGTIDVYKSLSKAVL